MVLRTFARAPSIFQDVRHVQNTSGDIVVVNLIAATLQRGNAASPFNFLLLWVCTSSPGLTRVPKRIRGEREMGGEGGRWKKRTSFDVSRLKLTSRPRIVSSCVLLATAHVPGLIPLFYKKFTANTEIIVSPRRTIPWNCVVFFLSFFTLVSRNFSTSNVSSTHFLRYVRLFSFTPLSLSLSGYVDTVRSIIEHTMTKNCRYFRKTIVTLQKKIMWESIILGLVKCKASTLTKFIFFVEDIFTSCSK